MRRQGVLPAANETLGSVHVSAAYFLVVTVFGLDLVVPLGAGISFFYLVPVVFLALWSSPKQSLAVMRIAAFSSILIAVGFLLSPRGVFWYAVMNRSYAFIVIGATVMLSVVRKGTEEDIKMLRGLLPICSYCKKIRDDQGYWQQVERYIAARSEADFSHSMCPDCGTQHFPDIVAEPATKASTKNPLGFFGQPESAERAVLSANGPTFSVSIHSPTSLGHQTNVSIPIHR
jgi:hypothetical protein